ncbi:30S ribosomal protein S7 [Candidatus Woesearchaeota archaeon]|nr:MAG: 30S ribosomal protein S7 [Candidatus Woesearchaeota archaeon]
MEINVFNRWSTSGIKVTDPGLVRYITLKPRIVPKSQGRNIGVRFHKSKNSIVERLINKLMVAGHKGKKHLKTSGHNTGKNKALQLVEKAFEIIESKTNKNPIEVLVKAIGNAAPREEIITIEYGGARYPKAVECAPQRRIDIALRQMVQGAYHKAFNSKKKAAQTLAEEIINAYNLSGNSIAIVKKLELERQADSSR